MASLSTTDRPPTSDLVHPAVLAAVALLLVNDHLLKGSGLLPGWLTGKLSDVAGLFFFPVLLTVVAEATGRRLGREPTRRPAAAVAAALTGLVFAALKLSPWLAAEASRWAGPIVCDPSDLLAVPMVVLAHRYLTRHTPAGPAPRWAQAVTTVVAALASMATSPIRAHRGYAYWATSAPPDVTIGCARASLWISKSGKQGVGVTLRLTSSESACVVQLQEAHLRLAEHDVVPSLALPQTIAASVDSPPRPPPDPTAFAFPPNWQDHGAYVYLPFSFDENTAWNSGQLEASLALRLRSQDRDELWTLPLRHVYEGYHPADTREQRFSRDSIPLPPSASAPALAPSASLVPLPRFSPPDGGRP